MSDQIAPQFKAGDSGIWRQYSVPFRHFRAENALSAEHYSAAESVFRDIVQNTESGGDGPWRLERGASRYTARMLAITSALGERLFPIFSESWIRSLYDLMGLPFLPRIDAALHSHPVDSDNGWIHTDFCSAWFDESETAPEAGIVFPNRTRCQYFDGVAKVTGANPVEYARAATLILYLANDGWQPGDGGETGLYGAAHESANSACELVPPLNNTLVFFECSPRSYHRFLGNPGRVRNSLILWLHCTIEDAQARWGVNGLTRRKPK